MHQNITVRKTCTQLLLLLCLAIFLQLIAASTAPFFAQYFFIPFQIFRAWLLRWIPFSVGDLLYAIVVIYLFYTLFLFLKRVRRLHKNDVLIIALRIGKKIVQLYILLFLLWGIHYEQPKLATQLSLETDSISNFELVSFDSLLIERLNKLESQYKSLNVANINSIAALAYQKNGTKISVWAKPTLMGNALAYFGIEGYFNPFTGEAQVNNYNPHFMQPFVVAHEMAHQTGIAAEDDANLRAYITCVESNNPSLQYSAYFNIWLYTHRRVKRIDSAIAHQLKLNLNARSLAQLDTLRQRNIQYHTFWDDASSFIFDVYLKFSRQKEGIGTYKNVAYSALCWEKKKKNE